jgi:hypothetical protein
LQAVDLSTVIYVNDGDKWIADVVDTVIVPGVNKTKLRNIVVRLSHKNPIATDGKWKKNFILENRFGLFVLATLSFLRTFFTKHRGNDLFHR